MSGSRTRLTSQQLNQIIRWRERGWSYKSIGDRLGKSAGAILYQCLRLGALSPRQRRQPAPVEPVAFTGFGRTVRRFSADEDRRLLELEAEGLKVEQIAAAMNRPRTSVRIRLMRLALVEELPS